jgi:hypothetical protein
MFYDYYSLFTSELYCSSGKIPNFLACSENPSLIFNLDKVFNDNVNENDRAFKLLGVYIDEYFSFDKHVSYICSKLSRSIYCIKRVFNIVTSKALRSPYFALVHPHLLYCSSTVSFTSNANIKKIFNMQKKQ